MYQNIPLGSYLQASVPTPKMRAGDFSEFPNIVLKDPYNNNAPFPGNQIPSNRFRSISQTIMSKYYPLPNQSWNTFTNNYGWLHPFNRELYKGNWPFVRIDHKLTNSNNLYVRYMIRKTPYIWTQGVGELFDSTQTRDHRGLVASDTTSSPPIWSTASPSAIPPTCSRRARPTRASRRSSATTSIRPSVFKA